MRKIFILLTTVFVCVLAEKADALEPTEAKEKAKVYATKIIDQCFKEADKTKPSGTIQIRDALTIQQQCLEKEIIKLNKDILPKNHFKKNIERLDLLGTPYGLYFSFLYNSNKACQPSCGTMFHTIGSMKHVILLGQILEDTAFVGYENDLIK